MVWNRSVLDRVGPDTRTGSGDGPAREAAPLEGTPGFGRPSWASMDDWQEDAVVGAKHTGGCRRWTPRGTTAAACREAARSRHLPSTARGRHLEVGAGGCRVLFAAMLATREEIDAALDDQRPPDNPPDLPHRYASELKVPGSHREAMRSEHALTYGTILRGGTCMGFWMRGRSCRCSNQLTNSSTISAYISGRHMSPGGPLGRSRGL